MFPLGRKGAAEGCGHPREAIWLLGFVPHQGKMSRTGTKIRDKGRGGSRVYLGDGEAGSSTTLDPRRCRTVPWHREHRRVRKQQGRSPRCHLRPQSRQTPRGFAGGVLLRSSFLLGWAVCFGFELCLDMKVFPEEVSQPLSLLHPFLVLRCPVSSRLEFSLPEAFPNINRFKCTATLKRTESLVN